MNSKFLTILLAIVSFAAIVANTLGYISVEIMLVVLGLTGSGTIAAWRKWINSNGYKTYLIVGVVVLGTVAFLLQWITLEQFIALFILFTGGEAATLMHAYKKAPSGEKHKIAA